MRIEDVCLFNGYKNRNSAVWRLNRLVENKLIQREKCVFGFYIYVPNDFKGLDVASFGHDQTAKNLAHILSQQYKCQYKTIRELRSEAYLDMGVLGLSKKIPDFVLVQNERNIAIEVELSQKSIKRQRTNIEKYIESLAKGDFMLVMYYCGTEAIKARVDAITAEKGVQELIKTNILPDGVRYEQ